MTDVLSKDLAAATRGLVIAPAGCGKTHLISDSVQNSEGLQLILTHTHAGVKAIRDRMARLGVSPKRFRVATIDAFALRYANAFPGISGWTIREPEGAQWAQLRPAATTACKAGAVISVLRATYRGVFVDEYQDCTHSQHALVMQLTEILPVRVLGDPLQAIFWKVNKTEALPWRTVVESFPLIGELTNPWRWRGKNPALGEWLLKARRAILLGETLDLATAPGVSVRCCEPNGQQQIAACYELLNRRSSSVVALRQWRKQCHKLAGNLNNTYCSFEDAQCEDLLKWARKVEATMGSARVEAVGEFAAKWLTRLPWSAVRAVAAGVATNKNCRARRPDAKRLHNALLALREKESFDPLVEALDAYSSFAEKPVYASREVWNGMRSAAKSTGTNSITLVEAVLRSREQLRHQGRHPASRNLATPLLVKGLEFEHVAILDTADFPDAESLYVSLTRASQSMIILSRSTKLRLKKPIA
jgi:DNA helicase-2/ATP-dependent DNA helicase PcrA